MPQYAQDLRTAVLEAAPRLLAFQERVASYRPAPDKWSPKEIIGHLIDSACSNHARFVNAPSQENMVFNGYAQVEWVHTQKYQEASWKELVSLWKYYNLHLAHVMESIPEEVRMKKHNVHSLHKMAMRLIPEDEPTTLDYLMDDYVFHLKHHLKQIFEIVAIRVNG